MAKKQSAATKQSAEKRQAKVRYDDFIDHVQPDPAKPEATVMLAGFIGHGAEGHVRIYPDASLGTWYDLAEDDIVHAMPIADSKLGGSYVWARVTAAIKPGTAVGGVTHTAVVACLVQPTPSAVQQCGQPPGTAGLICTETCPPGGFPTAHHCVAVGTPATLCSKAPGCPAAPFAAAVQPNTQATKVEACYPYPTQMHCCTMAEVTCAQTCPCQHAAGAQAAPAANMLAAAPVGTFQTIMCHTAAPCGPSLACTALPCALTQMACAPQALAPVGAHTNPPTLGCSGGCYAPGAYPARTGVFTPYC